MSTTVNSPQPSSTPPPARLGILRGIALFLSAAALFLSYNFQAYRSFFFDDAFDHLTWTRVAAPRIFLEGLLSWKFLSNNFRPVAHYYYHAMYQLFGFDYPGWVAFLHIFHLLSVCLVWLIIRRFGASLAGATIGTLFFLLNMCAFYVYWRPMFHFDLLCGFFILLSLYLYQRGNLIGSLLAFWFAYKCKEIGVTVPAILLAYEWWFGGRRWLRIVPFALISASFTGQAFLDNRANKGGYTMHLGLQDIWTCVQYYADHVLFAPYLGFLLPMLALIRRDSRIYFGLWFAFCTIAPLFLFPARLFDAYLYIPAAGLAIAFAFFFDRRPLWLLAPVAAAWLFVNAQVLSEKAPPELELASHNQHFFNEAMALARRHPEIRAITFRNSPPEMGQWGLTGVYRLAFPTAKVFWADNPAAQSVATADVTWDFEHDKLLSQINRPANEGAVISLNLPTSLNQLTTGWYPPERGFIWMQPQAQAKLRLPAAPREFFLTFAIVDGQLPAGGTVTLQITLAGQPLPAKTFISPGTQSVSWPLAPATLAQLHHATDPAGFLPVALRVTPPFHPPNGDIRTLGLVVTAFGLR